MSGVRPGPEAVRVRPSSYRIVLWSLLLQPEPPRNEIEKLLDPSNRPVELRRASRAELMPPVDECRAALAEWVEEALTDLRQTEERVLREVDGPQLGYVTDQGAIIYDPEKARLFQRAASESRTTFYRGLNTLRAMRKEEAAAEKETPRRARADRNESRVSEEAAANLGAVAGRPGPAARPRRVPPRINDIDTPATAMKRPGGRVESAPEGQPQVSTEPKLEEREGGVEADTRNEPTAAEERRPEERGILTDAGDDSQVERGPERGRPVAAEPRPTIAQGVGPEAARLLGEPGLAGAARLDATPAPGKPAAARERPIKPWIREYYTDERLAEMMARYRAKIAAEVARELAGEEASDSPGEWTDGDADPPAGPEPPPFKQ
jgi:hypothetical protein